MMWNGLSTSHALRVTALRSLAADRRVRTGYAVVTAAVVLAVVYILWAKSFNVLPVGTPVPLHASVSKLAQLALGNVRNWIFDFTGSFGWPLTNPPLLGLGLVLFSVSAVVLGGLLTGDRRKVAVLAALIATALVLPVLIIVSQARKDGIVWQARYSFPLYCGVILLAGAITRTWWQPRTDPAATRSPIVRRLTVIVAICVAGGQLADLMWAIRRYTVGLSGPPNVFAHVRGGFSPPVSTALLVVAALGLCAAYGWWIVFLSGGIPSASADFGHEVTDTVNLVEQCANLPETPPRVLQ